jgi:hypothetical protein
MTAVDARHAHQQAVAALLDAIEERRQRLNVLQTYGVHSGGLSDLSQELEELRAELATTVGAQPLVGTG